MLCKKKSVLLLLYEKNASFRSYTIKIFAKDKNKPQERDFFYIQIVKHFMLYKGLDAKKFHWATFLLMQFFFSLFI